MRKLLQTSVAVRVEGKQPQSSTVACFLSAADSKSFSLHKRDIYQRKSKLECGEILESWFKDFSQTVSFGLFSKQEQASHLKILKKLQSSVLPKVIHCTWPHGSKEEQFFSENWAALKDHRVINEGPGIDLNNPYGRRTYIGSCLVLESNERANLE